MPVARVQIPYGALGNCCAVATLQELKPARNSGFSSSCGFPLHAIPKPSLDWGTNPHDSSPGSPPTSSPIDSRRPGDERPAGARADPDRTGSPRNRSDDDSRRGSSLVRGVAGGSRGCRPRVSLRVVERARQVWAGLEPVDFDAADQVRCDFQASVRARTCL